MGLAVVTYSAGSNDGERFFRQLEDRFLEKRLSYYASRLLDHGLEDQPVLEEALSKAMAVVCSARMKCSNHFKQIYVSRKGQLQADWLVSVLGMRTIIMQMGAKNPELAAMQVGMLSSGY
ncbi:hypothetical protein LZZ85_15510 [Terrimonas sp. NA20]|uniref:Uncharacterized protein n=1 Tax=Terrimonas ginsenosidimutans TaxID=2908004 RepID=A0ABS9KTT6_9BACT|nr:hypothetical protein [Terrimonas ginsenosidimutans]MCG2615707.1 hypothetical protein [Terrimonas ginsenosidimutans]